MLEVCITPNKIDQFTTLLHQFQFTFYDESYRLYHDKVGLISVVPSHKSFYFHFFDQEKMEHFQEIHTLLAEIIQLSEATYDDHKAFLGYLEDGSKTYILTNWHKWLDYLNEAKHISMQGQLVKLFSQEYKLLSEGLLLSFENNNTPFTVTACTLITANGEQFFQGDSLIIEATGQFF